MRRYRLPLLVSIALLSVPFGAARAEDLTLPAVASIVGAAPFFSDVRAFNTSYSASLSVTATYRCFIGPCAATAPTTSFTLAPRQSMAFNDIVATTFNSPNTAGGVEFHFSAPEDQLVVTSRLYSTSPTPTVGMFIPALKDEVAHPQTVLTSIQNGGAHNFRTNVGVFNPGDSAVNVTFTLLNETGNTFGAGVTRSVPAHSGVQVSGIFGAANVGSTVTSNSAVTVVATGNVFSYAAVIDGNTTDPIFVVGAADQAAPAGGGGAPQTKAVSVPVGQTAWLDATSQSSNTTIHVGDTVQWSWSDSTHGVVSGTCTGSGGGGGYGGGYGGCNSDGKFSSGVKAGPATFSFTFTQAGSYPYFCAIHEQMMKGTIEVENP